MRRVFLIIAALSVAAFSMFPHGWHGAAASVAHALVGFGAGLGIASSLSLLRRNSSQGARG